MDEKERLASASYVNYGPTTNNGLAELQAREGIEKPHEGAGEMLRSTLEDGFKAMFPGMQPSSASISQAVKASKAGQASPYLYGMYPSFSPYPMGQFLHHQQQLQLRQQQQQAQLRQQHQRLTVASEGEWPGLNHTSPSAPKTGVIGGGVAKKGSDVAGPRKSSGEFFGCIKGTIVIH